MTNAPNFTEQDYTALLHTYLPLYDASRLRECLSSPDSLRYFRVNDLKQIIGYLRVKTSRNIRISGNKNELISRICSEIFPSYAGNSAPILTQTFPWSRISHEADGAPPQKRRRTSESGSGDFMDRNEAFKKYQQPFFKQTQQLHQIAFGNQAIGPQKTIVSGLFKIPEAVFLKIKKHELEVHMRLFSTVVQKDITLACSANLAVNGRKVDITKHFKKIRTKHVKTPFCTPHPLELSSALNLTDNIVEFRTPSDSGYAVVQLVKTIPIPDLIASLPRVYWKKPPAKDGDIEEVQFKISLRCPLGYCRITNPAKGKDCTHHQCFDANFYLQFCQQQRLWHCPVCAASVPYCDLIYDSYFNEILSAVDQDCVNVMIFPDGTYSSPDKTEKKRRVKPGAGKEVTVEEITVEESDEDEQFDTINTILAAAEENQPICNMCKRSEGELNRENECLKKCGDCSVAMYCSVNCQQQDWPEHRLRCRSLKAVMHGTSSNANDAPNFNDLLSTYYADSASQEPSYSEEDSEPENHEDDDEGEHNQIPADKEIIVLSD